MSTFKNKIDSAEVAKFIRYLKLTEQTFNVVSTGYSKTVKHNGDSYSFITDQTPVKTFAVNSAIKRDAKASGLVLDEVPQWKPRYFSVYEHIDRGEQTPETMYLVDIASAYLTCLLNAGIISKETFTLAQSLKKTDRLKAVGMLATSKLTMEFQTGTLKRYFTTEEREYRNFFFFACYQVGELLNKVANAYREAFVFFWVDGIYIKANPTIAEAMFSDAGYKFKTDTLTGCKMQKHKNYISFEYKAKEEQKTFCIPFEDVNNRVYLSNYLNQLKHGHGNDGDTSRATGKVGV